MGKVPSLGKVKAHESVSRPETGHHNGHIGLRSGMRLYVCIFSFEKPAQTVDRQLLYLIHDLASSIVSRSGIALGILVRADGTKCGKHLVADIIFGCNQLYAIGLTFFLFFD